MGNQKHTLLICWPTCSCSNTDRCLHKQDPAKIPKLARGSTAPNAQPQLKRGNGQSCLCGFCSRLPDCQASVKGSRLAFPRKPEYSGLLTNSRRFAALKARMHRLLESSALPSATWSCKANFPGRSAAVRSRLAPAHVQHANSSQSIVTRTRAVC